MRLGIITPWFPTPEAPYGGIFVAQQAAALAAAGQDVTVLHLDAISTMRLEPAQKARIEEVLATAHCMPVTVPGIHAGISVIRVPFISEDGVGFLARADSARAQLDRAWPHLQELGGFDLLHAHVALPSGHAAMGRGLPVVTTEHYSGIDRIIKQGAAREALVGVIEGSRFLCVSDFLRSRMVALLEDTGLRIDVLPNMVDFDGLDYSPRSSIAERWLYVGSLKPGKNVALALRTFARFRESRPEVTLTVVGDGPLRESLHKLAHELGISDATTFTGALPRANAAAHMQQADLLIHLSEFETFGLTCVEAIGSGAPVVSMANGGAECAWGDIEGAAGRILSPYIGDQAIAREISRLATNADQLDLETAASWVREQYNPAAIAKRLTSIYEELVS